MTIHINTDYDSLSPYKVFIMLALVSGAAVILRLCTKRGIPVKKSLFLGTLTAPMAVVCAVIFTLIISGGKRIGLASIGAAGGVYLAAILISLLWQRTGDRKVMLQNCTFALPLMYGIAKLGCLTAGCCHGIEYSGPLSIEYSGGESSVFPVQALESAVFMAIFIYGIVRLKKHDVNSVRKLIILSAAAKSSLEFLRESHVHRTISFEQAVCLTVIIIFIIKMRIKLPAITGK